MARTRQTARKSTSGSFQNEPRYNLLGIQENRELIEKLIQRNCIALMKNSLDQNVVKEDRVDVQTKFAPYRDCLKVARLWILKDLLQNHNSVNDSDQNIQSSLLTTLPMDVKIEIISFIPTFSNVTVGRNYERRGALKQTLSVRDPWFFSYIKHRLVSQSVRNHLEQAIFKRLKDETLDLSIFLTSINPSLFTYRVKVIKYLLKMQNKYLEEKTTDYKFFTLPAPTVTKPLRDPFYPDYDDDESENQITVFNTTNIDGEGDLEVMNVDELDKLEKNLIKDLPNIVGNLKPQFKKEPPMTRLWTTLNETQAATRREIHSSLSYYDPYQTFISEMDPQDEEEIDEDDEIMNNHVKTLRVSASELTSPNLLNEILSSLTKIERLELLCYNIHEGNRNLMFFTSRISVEEMEALESVTVTYVEPLSSIGSYFTQLSNLLNVKKILLKVIVDTKEIPYMSASFPNHNIYVNSEKVHDVPTSEYNIYISSITLSDIKNSNNPWYATKALFSILSSKNNYSIETMKDITTFVLKRYSPQFTFLEIYLESLFQTPTRFALLQYIIYLCNTNHNGELFFNFPNIPEKSLAQLIYCGWDVSNQILELFTHLGPDFGQVLLDHWSHLLKHQLCKLDIPFLRKNLANIINSTRNCRLLAFICEHCSHEERIELFNPFQYGFFAEQSFQTTLVNIMCEGMDGVGFSYILKYLPPECLLEKSLKIRPNKILTCTSLQFVIDNQKISNEAIVAFIEKQPLLIHISDNEGITPLHRVCISANRWSLIPLLLKYNVDTQAKDSKGETPLDYLKRCFPFYKFVFPYLNEISQLQ